MTKENLIEPIVNHLSIHIVTRTSYQTPSLYKTSTNQGRTQITDNEDAKPLKHSLYKVLGLKLTFSKLPYLMKERESQHSPL
jgi:hypothetical protein